MARRFYNNTAVPVALTSNVNASQPNLPVSSSAGYPTPPFTAGIERGTANEEVVLITAVPDGNTFTATRGYNGTTGKAHGLNAPVEHCVVALDYDEANAHVNDASLHAGAPTGLLAPFGGATGSIPSGWLLCNGQAVSRTTYAALHVMLRDAAGASSYPFGAGDGVNTFNLPDIRGRTLIGLDNMGGTSANRVVAAAADIIGGNGGVETVTLAVVEMPSHAHVENAHVHVQNPHTHVQNSHNHPPPGVYDTFWFADNAAAASVATGSSWTGNNTVGNTGNATAINQNTTPTEQATTPTMQNSGGGGAHNNMQPYIAIQWIIKV